MATVEEQIIDDVASTFLDIDGTGNYETTIKAVHRQGKNAQRIPIHPAAIIVHGGTRYDDSRLGMIQCELTLYAYLTMRADGGDWAQDLQGFIGDAERALLADPDRNNLAIKTAVTAAEVFDGEEIGDGSVSAAEIRIVINFRHAYNEPNTVI